MRIHEIKIISDLEDQELDELLPIRYEQYKDDLSPIKKLGPIEVQGSYWPLSDKDYNRFYFVDKNAEPVGYAIIVRVLSSGIKKLYFVKMVYIKPVLRRQGIISLFYQFLLDNGNKLITDHDQTKSSKMVWKKLLGKYNLYLTDLSENPIKKIENEQEFELAYEPGNIYHKIIATK